MDTGQRHRTENPGATIRFQRDKRATKMKIEEVLQELARFKAALDANADYMSFVWEQVRPWNGYFKDWFRKEVPGEGASKKSGVYFIMNGNKDILYIGKATTGNLGAEICGKFRVPTQIDQADMPVFENSGLAKYAPAAWKPAIIQGNLLILAVIIEPAVVSSLVEVYLQTWCERCSGTGLPPLNKRVG